jgi:CMP-N-acetylneuraminic acid synthetase
MGSKGLPGKNRILFDHTARIIPKNLVSKTYVSTNDDVIKDKAKQYGFNIIHRAEILSDDDASMKDVAIDFVKTGNIDDKILLLYLTYPQRSWTDVEKAIEEIDNSESKSLLCAFECETHPFLTIYDRHNNKGVQVVNHDLYRRQDYPKCLEISHLVSIFYSYELINLNRNLYNENTHFMKCEKKIDIDLPIHLEKFKES